VPEPMEIILTNQVLNAASQTTLDLSGLITAMQSSGMSNDAIKTVLMNDLRSGGRIFGSFRNSLKNITKNGVEYSSNQAQKNIYADAKVPKFQWVSVGDNSVCPDCDRRNGQVEPMEYWETVGLPKSGFSICQTNCRCPMPVPASYTGENLDKPLLRGKRVAANLPKKYQKLRTTDLSAEQLKSYNTLARAKSTGKITNDQWQNGLLEILEGKKVGAKGLKVDYRGVKDAFIQKKITIEKSILTATGNKWEMGVLMDSKGNELLRKKGTKYHVNITRKDLSGIDTKNTIFTHNHPNSLSFSLNDILFAGELGLKEIRAIAPNSNLGSVVFKLRPKSGGGWANTGKIRSAFSTLRTKHLGKRAVNKWLRNTDDGLVWKSKLDDVVAKREVLKSRYLKKEISLDEYGKAWKKSRKEWRKIAREAQEDFLRKISGDFAQLQKELADELGMVMDWEAL